MEDMINRKALEAPARKANWISKGRPHTGSKPARTRDGATYPGGKHMRKALAKLALRTKDFAATYSPGAKGGKGVNGEGYFTAPGSRKR